MSALYLVRHGPTHAKGMVGWTDLPADLSDADAIARVDAFLPQDAIVISSDLIRAIDTADAVAPERTRLAHDPDLREIHFGDWEMQTFDEINAKDSDRIFQFYDSPGSVGAPNGEDWVQFSNRTYAAIDRLTIAHPDQDLIIVAHFGVVVAQIQRALGISAYAAFGHKISNLSVTRIPRDKITGAQDQDLLINHLP